MKQTQGFPIAVKLMTEFARLSGLAPAGDRPRRYLWTDAFAVCNFLGSSGREQFERGRSIPEAVSIVKTPAGLHPADAEILTPASCLLLHASIFV